VFRPTCCATPGLQGAGSNAAPTRRSPERDSGCRGTTAQPVRASTESNGTDGLCGSLGSLPLAQIGVLYVRNAVADRRLFAVASVLERHFEDARGVGGAEHSGLPGRVPSVGFVVSECLDAAF